MTRVRAGGSGLGKPVLSSGNQPLAFRFLGTAGDTTYLAIAKNVGAQADTLYVWAVCATVAS